MMCMKHTMTGRTKCPQMCYSRTSLEKPTAAKLDLRSTQSEKFIPEAIDLVKCP